jgi:hypothetical protein
MPENPIIPPPDKLFGSTQKSAIPPPEELFKEQPQREDPYLAQLNQTNSQDNILRMIDSLPEMPGDTEGKKQIIKDLVKRGGTAAEVTQTMETLRGKHPKQEGGTKYYMDEKGVANPISNSGKAPEGYHIASVFGTGEQSKDDNVITDLAKTAWNIFPSAAKGLVGVAQTAYEGITDKSSENLQSLENAAEALKFEKDPDIQGSLFNPEGMKSYKDVFDSKRWDLSPNTVWGNALALGQSVGEFMLPAKAAGELAKGAKWATKTVEEVDKVTGAINKIEKLTTAGKIATVGVASSIVNSGELRDAAEKAGLEGRDKAAFVTVLTPMIAAIDVKWGLGSKIFQNSVEKEAKDAFILGAAKKTMEKTVDGKLTKEALDEAVKETIASYPKLASTWAKEVFKDANEQGMEEAAQAFIKNAGEQVWDNISDEEKAKFGTKTFSPEAVGEYLQNYLSGTIGGAPTAVAFNKVKQIERDNNQSKTVFGVVQKGDDAIKTFKQNVQAAKENGELTEEEAKDAITRVNSYKEYNDITSSLKLPEEQKRESFDLTFQKQNLESQLEAMGDPKKMNPLEQASYDGIAKQSADLQKRINEIVLKAQVKNENVATEKTVKDVTKDEQPPKEGETKTKLSPEMQAMADKYKATTVVKTEDKRTYEETPNEEYNSLKFSDRHKHAITVKHLESLPDSRIDDNVVIDRPISFGKENNVFEVKMPAGKIIRFSSSKKRDDANQRGNLMFLRPKSLMKQDKDGYWEVDDEKLKGAKVGIKAYTIKNDGREKKVIKIFSTENNEDYGKFIGWAKETHQGKNDYSDKEINGEGGLIDIENTVEAPISPEQSTSTEPTQPTEPTTPKAKITEVKASRDEEVKQAKKPKVQVEMISAKNLVNSKNAIQAKKKHDSIKDKVKALKQLIDCAWQK